MSDRSCLETCPLCASRKFILFCLFLCNTRRQIITPRFLFLFPRIRLQTKSRRWCRKFGNSNPVVAPARTRNSSGQFSTCSFAGSETVPPELLAILPGKSPGQQIGPNNPKFARGVRPPVFSSYSAMILLKNLRMVFVVFFKFQNAHFSLLCNYLQLVIVTISNPMLQLLQPKRLLCLLCHHSLNLPYLKYFCCVFFPAECIHFFWTREIVTSIKRGAVSRCSASWTSTAGRWARPPNASACPRGSSQAQGLSVVKGGYSIFRQEMFLMSNTSRQSDAHFILHLQSFGAILFFQKAFFSPSKLVCPYAVGIACSDRRNRIKETN